MITQDDTFRGFSADLPPVIRDQGMKECHVATGADQKPRAHIRDISNLPLSFMTSSVPSFRITVRR
jgi:hypothetical protein